MPLAWGRTRLLETDWRLITQESHCFSCGIVNMLTTNATGILARPMSLFMKTVQQGFVYGTNMANPTVRTVQLMSDLIGMVHYHTRAGVIKANLTV